MNTTRRTNCQDYGLTRCRKQATHIAGGGWYCEAHAIEFVEAAQRVTWSRGTTMRSATPDEIAEIAQLLGR